MRGKKNKPLLIGSLLAMLTAGTLCADYIRIPIVNESQLKPGKNMLLERTANIADKIASFDQHKVLEGLDPNPFNGFYFRFDENIASAVFSGRRKAIEKPSYLLSFEFDGNDEVTVKMSDDAHGAVNMQGGILRIAAEDNLNHWVETSTPLQIRVEEIGKIELRAKTTKSGYMKFAWEGDYQREERQNEPGRYSRPTERIYMPMDDKFRTFKINAEEALTGYKRYPGKYIEKIFFSPAARSGSNIDIDYVRFYSKKERYKKNSFGIDRRIVRGEMRPVIYMNAPGSLRYSVKLTGSKVFLSFGTNLLKSGGPARVKVLIKDGLREKVVFNKHVKRSGSFENHKIDVSEFSGKAVDIIFSCKSKNESVVFFSNPILYGIPKKEFNVIFIIEDALRADHTSLYGYFRSTTPEKEKFAKKGTLFLNTFSQGPSTRVSMPSIMTSMYPSATGVHRVSDRLSERYLTLAEIMRSQGFVTAAIIQNTNAGTNANLHQGYSYFYGDKKSSGKKTMDIYLTRAPEWIREHGDKNFFLYLHILDPHGTYKPEEQFRFWYQQAGTTGQPQEHRYGIDPDWVEVPTTEGRKALYDGEIRANDFYFRKFLNKLASLGKLENTLIVFTSDHGEHLGAHDFHMHGSPGYLQVLKVPLLMVYPGRISPEKVIKKRVQHIDIMPTILEYARIQAKNFPLSGDSLVPLMNGQAGDYWDRRLIISEEPGLKKDKYDKNDWASIFFGKTHLLNSKRTGFKVFDYENDAEETHNLDPKETLRNYFGGVIKEFQGRSTTIWETLTLGEEESIEYAPAEIQQLRALGYLN